MTIMLGIDTGGTYTDAVLWKKNKGVVKASKSLTTKHNLALGITDSCQKILKGVNPENIKLVGLSSTLATNAIVEKQGSPVCLIMIGHSETALDKANLKDALDTDSCYFVQGGHKASGEENQILDEDKIIEIAKKYKNKVSAFAVCSIFSTRNTDHENRVKNILRTHTDLPVSLSSDLADSLDAPRRALTALLNARLLTQIQQLISAVQSFLDEHKIMAPLMIVQGNGSLMCAKVALEKPVETIMSGPAASVIGASHLTNSDNAYVSDIGGTTTDVAIIKDGMAVLSPTGANVNGWNTMVESIAVYTIGLGGDSQVHATPKGDIFLGPRRVTPIALLAKQHPHIKDTLQKQLANEAGRTYDGLFAHRLRTLDTDIDSLTASEVYFWNALEKEPQALTVLLADGRMPKPLYRLMDRGLVIMSAFTPSDASHILRRQDNWDRDASVLAGKLWARYERTQNICWAKDEHEFANIVLEQMTLQSSEALMSSTYMAENGADLLKADMTTRNIIRQSLVKGADSNLSFTVKFKQPIIGIGASAQNYYPAMADRLQAELINPDYADVANAVGAVSGKITKTITLTISAPDDDTFRVHSKRYQDFESLEKAVKYAIQYGTDTVEEYVKNNLGENIKTKVNRKDNIIQGDGANIFIQSILTIKSTGDPKLQ